jgi:hypothetical protein
MCSVFARCSQQSVKESGPSGAEAVELGLVVPVLTPTRREYTPKSAAITHKPNEHGPACGGGSAEPCRPPMRDGGLI